MADVSAGPPRTARPDPPAVAPCPRPVSALAAASRAPLVDPGPSPAERIVTWVWRGEADRVLLLANRLTDRADLDSSLLRRHPGTDVWSLSLVLGAGWRGSYQLAVEPSPYAGRATAGTAAGPMGRMDPADPWWPLMTAAEPDPLNPRVQPSKWQDAPAYSIAELPDAPPQPGWVDGPPSRVLPAREVDGRTVWRYGPGDGPLVVLLDGEVWAREYDLAGALDRLIAAGSLPPLTALLVEAGPDRGRDYAADEDFTSYLTGLIPPGAGPVVVAGQSLGGLAALHAGLRRPDLITAVAAQSPSLWWNKEALAGRYASAGRTPRLEVAVGTREWLMTGPARRFRDATGARLTEYDGGHDYVCWRGELTAALGRLLR